MMSIDQVRGMTTSLGVRVSKRERETVDVGLFPGSCALLETIDRIGVGLEGLKTDFNQPCRDRYPKMVCLEQIEGVGHITSRAFVLTLEAPTRCAASRTVGAYLGPWSLRPVAGQGTTVCNRSSRWRESWPRSEGGLPPTPRRTRR
jgi:hypothetical protein